MEFRDNFDPAHDQFNEWSMCCVSLVAVKENYIFLDWPFLYVDV